MSRSQWGHGFFEGMKAAVRQSKPEAPLIHRYDESDSCMLSDYWGLIAANIEDALLESGAVPGVDYSRLDLFKLAQPFVLNRWADENSSMAMVVSWPNSQGGQAPAGAPAER